MSEAERGGVVKLLADVKKNCVKSRSPSKNTSVRYMEPGFIQIPLAKEDGHRSWAAAPRSAVWLCIPFFSLQKYSGLSSGTKSGGFPVQTLMQAQYARTTERREMLQVVCQSGNVPIDYCFHIAQLWCIVLDNCEFPECFSTAHLC